MSNRAGYLIATVTTALLAVFLVGGTILGWLLGREPPNWLQQFDGMIIIAAFAGGAFFAQARAAEPTIGAQADLRNKYHQLAMAGFAAGQPVQVTTTPTGGTTIIPLPPEAPPPQVSSTPQEATT